MVAPYHLADEFLVQVTETGDRVGLYREPEFQDVAVVRDRVVGILLHLPGGLGRDDPVRVHAFRGPDPVQVIGKVRGIIAESQAQVRVACGGDDGGVGIDDVEIHVLAKHLPDRFEVHVRRFSPGPFIFCEE